MGYFGELQLRMMEEYRRDPDSPEGQAAMANMAIRDCLEAQELSTCLLCGHRALPDCTAKVLASEAETGFQMEDGPNPVAKVESREEWMFYIYERPGKGKYVSGGWPTRGDAEAQARRVIAREGGYYQLKRVVYQVREERS